jgi:hypothetical protein
MKKLLALVGFLLLASSGFAQTVGTHPGNFEYAWIVRDLTSPLGLSSNYSLTIGNRGYTWFTWQTSFSAAPAAVTITLEGSVDCATYSPIDTSTNVNGEVRMAGGLYKCVRFNNSAVTTGAGKNLTVAFIYSYSYGLGSPQWMPVSFSALGTPNNGTFYYCSDCTIANPCAGGGTGALAKRLNGVWVCN